MRARGPDERSSRLAWYIDNVIAANVAAARESVQERLTGTDSYPTQTIGASPPIGIPHPKLEGPCLVDTCEHTRPCPDHDGATLTSVERSADARIQLNGYLEGLADRLEGGEIWARDLDRYTRMLLGRPTADDITHTVPMCRDNQLGKHGVAEWGDPLCPMTADKGGLCAKHYLAWWRARDRGGINVRGDHEPAA